MLHVSTECSRLSVAFTHHIPVTNASAREDTMMTSGRDTDPTDFAVVSAGCCELVAVMAVVLGQQQLTR